MKIKEEYHIKSENGQNIIACDNKNPENVIVLGNTATLLFHFAKEKDRSETEMLEYLLENTDISTVLALNDLNVFIKLMKENDIFE